MPVFPIDALPSSTCLSMSISRICVPLSPSSRNNGQQCMSSSLHRLQFMNQHAFYIHMVKTTRAFQKGHMKLLELMPKRALLLQQNLEFHLWIYGQKFRKFQTGKLLV
nr:hypothetical protein Iba_chr06cCG1100 [Ipomoea batatas]GMD11530.1 hypothetical protein Iba_chr06fCG4620 [Ipomoea batatas]